MTDSNEPDLDESRRCYRVLVSSHEQAQAAGRASAHCYTPESAARCQAAQDRIRDLIPHLDPDAHSIEDLPLFQYALQSAIDQLQAALRQLERRPTLIQTLMSRWVALRNEILYGEQAASVEPLYPPTDLDRWGQL